MSWRRWRGEDRNGTRTIIHENCSQMIIIIIALTIVGFVFPPAWLALLGYGIYIFASRISRRDDAVESRVKKMVSAGRGSASFSDLYFEAARSYAIEKGAKAPEPNAASANILVDGRKYFVVFLELQAVEP